VLYRADRIDAPVVQGLRLDRIEPDDGWCDAPGNRAYNRPVRLPYPASHEVMTREDGLYDLVVILGHNDDPPAQGLGSAVFLHCMAGDGRATLGCIGVEQDRLQALVARLRPGDSLQIAP
jgi:L,D-peptidoglycan transpeptidase YkuD (ErfK/YbiS/YcfS/YnhG family)